MEIQKPKGLGLNSLVRKKYKEWQTMGLPKAGEQYKNTNVDQITMVAAKDEILGYLGWVRSDKGWHKRPLSQLLKWRQEVRVTVQDVRRSEATTEFEKKASMTEKQCVR